ncbi:MAG: N-acetylglucosamine-6-phosphate deacetylase [Candidatus Dormibacteria bacterium]
MLTLSGCLIVTPDEPPFAGWVSIEGTQIVDVGRGGRAGGRDLGGAFVAPGFLDLHVHGGGGASLMSGDPAELREAARFHFRHGTTGLLATAVSTSEMALIATIDAAAGLRGRSMAGEAEVIGVHLEGPYLNTRRAGAADPEQLRPVDPAETRRLVERATGVVRLVTLAPELPGAVDLARWLRSRGVIVALGHTDATYEEALAAIGSGLSHATHTFNAMPTLHHRHPGAALAALGSPDVTCELIVDGIHLHPAIVTMVHRLKGTAGTVLVTDAIAAAGLGDGAYQLGEQPIQVSGGRATLRGTDVLAGSTLTMDGAVRNAMAAGIPLAEALEMASLTPARVLRLDDRKGRIEPGYEADLVVLSPDLEVMATFARGVSL